MQPRLAAFVHAIQISPSITAAPDEVATIVRLGTYNPSSAEQFGQRRDSNGTKPWQTGQANARTGHMVAHMQLLVIRHALPLRSEPGQGSDPELSEDGIEQAKRLPDALARFPISRLVSSPQRRAIQTAQPVADALGLPVDIDDRLAEYDRASAKLHAPTSAANGS